MIAAEESLAAPIPREGEITWRFELLLLMRHAERNAGALIPEKDLSETRKNTLWRRVLACLPIGAERALRPVDVHARLPDQTRDCLSAALCYLVERQHCKRIGPLGKSRYYRES